MKNIAILIADIIRGAGTERAVVNLANMLVKNGDYGVTILSCFSSSEMLPYFAIDSRVKIVHFDLKMNKIFDKFSSYEKIIAYTNRYIRKNKMDILLGTGHALNCLMFFMSKKVKKIACEHMSYEACPLYSRVIRFFIYPLLDAVVLLTASDAERYNFIDTKKIFIIPNSLSFTCDTPSKLDKKRIIAVGRLTFQKGFDILIKTATLLKGDLSDWRIDIFGEGEDKDKLLLQIQNNYLEDFVFISEPTKKIKTELLDSSIYVMTSRFEGFPMILLEAKACGLPIVSFDCPEGPADIITDEVDGYLVDCGNITDLAKKIISLAKSYELRKKIGANARISSEKYLPESIFLKWDNLFKNI